MYYGTILKKEMGAYLSEPITKKHMESGCVEKYGGEYATCSMQGWRKHQEDAHIAPRYFVRNISDTHTG